MLSSLLGAILALALFLPHNNDAQYDDFVDMATRIDAILDESDRDVEGVHGPKSMNNWIQETVPFFVYEGMSYYMVYPDIAKFTYYDVAQRHVHLLGTANCFADDLDLNARFTNPVSPMYNDPSSISTLVHELAHVQGICFSTQRLNHESSAQLATMEVLAAMANRGNADALYVLLDELRYMFVTGARIAAEEEGRGDEYRDLVEGVYGDDPLMIARIDKSLRYWQDTDLERFYEIVRLYNYEPAREILSHWQRGQPIRGISLPINIYCSYGYASYPYGNAPTAFEIEQCYQPLKIDDLSYILHNLEYLGEAL